MTLMNGRVDNLAHKGFMRGLLYDIIACM